MAPSEPLNRRQALRTLAAGAVGAATAASWVESLSALAQAHAHTQTTAVMAAPNWKPRVLTLAQNQTVVTLTELIIPRTDTPGAKDANVNRFIDRVLQQAPRTNRAKFLKGLAWIDQRSTTLSGKTFAAATPAEQTTLLTRLADPNNKAEEDRPGVEFFQAIKSMTIAGYYTTEIGLRKELGDDGRLATEQFEGCTHPEHK